MNITKASQVIEETLTKLLNDEIDPKKARAVASLLHVNVQHAQLALDYAKLRGGPINIPSLEEGVVRNQLPVRDPEVAPAA